MDWKIKIAFESLVIIVILIFSTLNGGAQDLEQVAKDIKEKKIKISGNISANGQFYTTDAMNRAVPLSGNLSALLNVNFLGVNAPFMIHLGSGGELFNYNLPAYSFIGFSPKYKDFTLHVGDRTLNHNKYGFSGQSFRGIGFEYKPAQWFVSGFYGRIQRAKQEDLVGNHQLEPLYKRLGWGLSGGLDNAKTKLVLSLFTARDKDNSLEPIDSTYNVTPGLNTILGVETRTRLTKILTLKANVSYSGYTENTNEEIAIESSFIRDFGGLLESNLSTRWNFAFTTEAEVKTKRGKIAAGYERIDPGYRTFGSLFFQDDLQQLYLRTNSSLLDKKLHIGIRVGTRSNNLNSDQANNYNRFISSLNLTYNPNENLSLTGAYSTFRNVNKKNFVLDPVSPLLFTTYVLNNNTANLGVNFYLKKTKIKNAILRLNGDFATGTTIVNDEVDLNAGFNSYSANLIYQYLDTQEKMSFSVFQNNRFSSIATSDLVLTSIGANCSKSINDDLFRLGGQLSISRNARKAQAINEIAYLLNAGVNANYNISENVSIGLQTIYLKNTVTKGDGQGLSEFRCHLNCAAILK